MLLKVMFYRWRLHLGGRLILLLMNRSLFYFFVQIDLRNQPNFQDLTDCNVKAGIT